MKRFSDCSKCTDRRMCDEHSQPNYVLKDGERMRINTVFMDGVPSDTNAIRAQAQADHDEWKRQHATADAAPVRAMARAAYEEKLKLWDQSMAAHRAASGG